MMEQISKCKAFICNREEEQIQERIAESYVSQFKGRRRIKKHQKQNPPSHPTHLKNTIFSFKSQQYNSPPPQSSQHNDSFNKSSILVREEFNYKSVQKASPKQPQTKIPFSPQLGILNSPLRTNQIQNHQGSPYSMSSSQFAKKSLKASATGRENCKQKNVFHCQRTEKQRKGSYKSTDYSATQSMLISHNNGGETFQNTPQINPMNGGIRKIGEPERWLDSVKQLQKSKMQKLKSTDQLIIMNGEEHKTLPYHSNNFHVQNQTIFTKKKSNISLAHTSTFHNKNIPPQNIIFTDKTTTKYENNNNKKGSDKIGPQQQITFRTFIDSLRQEHFKVVQMEKDISSNYSQNGSYLRQSQSINSQSIFKDIKGQCNTEQSQKFNQQLPIKDRKPQHRQTAFAGQLNFHNKDMSYLTKQLNNIITMQSICSQRLDTSYVDINYPHKSKGNITKLL